jgi:hypothetical protein
MLAINVTGTCNKVSLIERQDSAVPRNSQSGGVRTRIVRRRQVAPHRSPPSGQVALRAELQRLKEWLLGAFLTSEPNERTYDQSGQKCNRLLKLCDSRRRPLRLFRQMAVHVVG